MAEREAYVGADVCPGGWIAIRLEDSSWKVTVHPSVFSLWYNHRDVLRIFIDVPIGLPELPAEHPRRCDELAREKLAPLRHNSIFQVPCRQATKEDNFESAKQVNEEILGSGLNPYSWGLCPHIREVDELLEYHPAAREVFRETHPEICFWALNGYEPLSESKTTSTGKDKRIELLDTADQRSSTIIAEIETTYTSRAVRTHDGIDALVAAITASTSADHLRTLPDEPDKDIRGLPMEIVYATQWLTTQSTVTDFAR